MPDCTRFALETEEHDALDISNPRSDIFIRFPCRMSPRCDSIISFLIAFVVVVLVITIVITVVIAIYIIVVVVIGVVVIFISKDGGTQNKCW